MRRLVSLFFILFSVMVSAQQIGYVDFEKIEADISFGEPGEVSGDLSVRLKISKNTDSIYLDAVNMDFKSLKVKNLTSGSEVEFDFRIEADKIIILSNFLENYSYELQFWYAAKPKTALYFVGEQIWTQGQGKYTSNWLPSIDDMNEKIEFDLSVSYDDAYQVLSNGKLIKKDSLDQGRSTWQYDMNAPMSSYLVALVIGRYSQKTEESASGIPLEYYYTPADAAKVDATYRYSKQMFDFLETEIGVPYPWEVYRQVPVKDFLYSGMENTTLTIFSDALVVDAVGFNDRNYVNVNAHELAHQWFGDFVTATSGTHHWLQEGFATYYALLAERDVFGEAYYYWRLHDYAQQLLAQENTGKSTSLLDPQSSSVTFYQKGCWALHVLREEVGDEAFKSAVKNYLNTHQFQNVETSDFITEVEQASGQDLTTFVQVWLKDVALPQDTMVKSLKQSEFIREYMDVSCETYPAKCQDYLVSGISDKAKVKILSQENYTIKLEDFNNSFEVRQAIAQQLTTIPFEYKTTYETLLNDASYITIETALYNLWVNFPADRAKYLQQTKDIYGFSDYNVKLLWLALHLNTIEYQPDMKEAVFDELKSYTDPQFGFELRMNAFNYLKLLKGYDVVALKNLIKGTTHHNWRFQKFAKEMMEELESVESYKEIIDKVMNQITVDNEY
ncbi:M1 family metallopeptidase [Gelidibacter salicanalis]|uniref:Aminopeptidase N n=1 Tax=Gelidibacter salicanalis TaxID=291193 RepID=A0A934NIV8_9FLAO|nr:M1 family metallopeptidase [Gelidibacter salicanalis]MBJ7882631.1 M1 family metallopeptidase [Gelidibacter salicanalis]